MPDSDLPNQVGTLMSRYEREMGSALAAAIRNFTPVLRSVAVRAMSGEIETDSQSMQEAAARIQINPLQMRPMIEQTFALAGQMSLNDVAQRIIRKDDHIVTFDFSSERPAQVVRDASDFFVTGVTRGLRDRLADVVTTAGEVEMPIEDARMWVREQVTLLPKHAEVIDRIRTALRQRDVPQRDIQRVIADRTEQYLQYRTTMITRTEVARAASLGQLEAWHQARDRGWVTNSTMREWVTAKDERTCPICRPMNGVQVRLNEPWHTRTGTVEYPSAVHPQCRCTSVLVLGGE